MPARNWWKPGKVMLLRDRHLAYFLELAEAAEPHLIRPEQLEWLAKLDADYENLRLALEWALTRESAEPSLRLCAALGHFWRHAVLLAGRYKMAGSGTCKAGRAVKN